MSINENRKYEISGEDGIIITKTGSNNWMGSICEEELDKSIEEHSWKIKILKTLGYSIMVGVATMDFDFNSASYQTNRNYGWNIIVGMDVYIQVHLIIIKIRI